MSTPIYWKLHGRYQASKEVLSKDDVEILRKDLELDDYDMNPGFGIFATFVTEGMDSEDDVVQVLQHYTSAHPDVEITAVFQYECEECPDQWLIKHGLAVRENGHVEFEPEERYEHVYEACPHCDEEQKVFFDLYCGHLEAECLTCHKPMMLCSVCPVRDGIGMCDWTESGCKYSRKNMLGGHA